MKERIIEAVQKSFPNYSIDCSIMSDLYDEMIANTQLPIDNNFNLEYFYYFILEEKVINYLINKIKTGASEYEAYLLIKLESVIKRYNSLNKLKKLDSALYNSILNDFIDAYDKNLAFRKQMIKSVKKIIGK